ncbi:hypothetical protein CXG81DRAFT_16282 [Caulochytrium protostelioides]|uniref:Kinetochore protein SPC25 n=1 Tax=Caulochytrium protostelioides TaxID=1555241 RepID=A0A4P9XFF5_9FUNG|nr:hypothetical protein CXG81DRAFT_16282 [Caulochytrium protostelioides]|eukprot:RKP04307.1 hypothetical protein CXG81DRAFT_16282 [Caulochytrium protostelioides]
MSVVPTTPTTAPTLRSELADFQCRFDDWVRATQQQRAAQQDAHRRAAQRQAAEQRDLEAQRDQWQAAAATARNEAAHTVHDRDAWEARVASAAAAREAQHSEAARWQARVAALETALAARRAERAAKQQEREASVRSALPELTCYEHRLAMRYRRVRPGVVRFDFTHVDESDWDRVFAFTLQVQTPTYAVLQCTPPLPAASRLVAWLNEDRNFNRFLKHMRRAFVDLARAEKADQAAAAAAAAAAASPEGET